MNSTVYAYLFTGDSPVPKIAEQLLDETRIVFPDQFVLFNITDLVGGCQGGNYCYYVSVKALHGNFAIFLSIVPMSGTADLKESGGAYSKTKVKEPQITMKISPVPFLGLHFETANIFRIQLWYVPPQYVPSPY